MADPLPVVFPSRPNGLVAVVAEEKTTYDAWRPLLPPELFCPEIGVIAIAVYGAIALHFNGQTGEARPSQDTIAKRLGISRKTVNTAVKLLAEKGFVEVIHRTGDGGGQISNSYALPHQKPRTYKVSPTVTGVSPTVTGVSPTVTPPESHGYTNQRAENQSKEPSLRSGKKTPTYPDEMMAFWNAYDAKGRERSSRDQVLGEWKKIDPRDIPAIMAAVAAWAKSSSWRDGYALGAHRFLQTGKWRDVPATDQGDDFRKRMLRGIA